MDDRIGGTVAKTVCPHCGRTVGVTYKKKGITKCCTKEVVTVNENWYKALEEAPEWQVIMAYVEGRRRSLPFYEIPYGSSTYREYLKGAIDLLKKCDGDIALALDVVKVAFTDPRHASRNKPTIFSLTSKLHFYSMLAIAKGNTVRAKQQSRLEQAYAASAMRP